MSRDALVVGVSTYTHLPPLSKPAADAEAIAKRLEEDGDFHKIQRLPEAIDKNSQEKKAVVAKKLPISQLQLEQALERLFPDSQQAPETALFYFSGHGIPDSKGYDGGYLATTDTDPHNPHSGISFNWLHWLLSKSSVKQQIIWLDCCHSGSLLVNVEAANPGHSQNRDRCFVASSRDFEPSWEDLNSPYSVLTKALLEGLDPTRLPGRWIDTFALVDYINQAIKGELQIPVCTNFGKPINVIGTWQSSVQSTSTNSSQIGSGICPYKGLEFFDCNDEDPKYFFGRDQLIGQLLDYVRTNNFLALVGASGNGKSSVLRAGLLYQLQLGRRITGSDRWRIRISRPDRQPMQNLALAFVDEGLSDLDRAEALGRATGLLNEGASGLQRLVQASTAPRVILVIDQFEEVFTRCDSIEERERFFACLMEALSNTNDKLCLIIAMRADFIGKCLEQPYSGLAQQIQQHLISVLPLEPEELKAAICKPAEQVGLEIEPALVTEILDDIAGAPGSLPLLQYTLKELWQQRRGNQLVLSAYQDLGGINGTLDKRATEIYNSFEAAEQRTVQHIFQQLTQLGEGTEDTRRRVFQADLVAEPQHPAAQVQRVIERLSSPENRLLVTSEVISKGNPSARMAIVDVAHEALIRYWKLLRQWIEQNRDLLRQQRNIEANAVAWRDQGQKSGYLLQGLPLTEAIHFEKQQRNTFPLSDSARAFIQKSIRERHWNRLKTASWLIIPALLVIGLVEHNLREANVNVDRTRLDQEGTSEEKQAVQALVQGCASQQNTAWLPPYLAERLFGNCRSLDRAPLVKANLSNADLSNADLSYADLSNAKLSNANLSNADLYNANLSNADLSNADLSNADLYNAKLSYADLSYADLSNAKLSNADLSYAELSNADLSNADLSYADLSNADLYKAELSNAELSNAYFSDANFSDANLSNVNLSNTDFFNTDFFNSILLATDLRNTPGMLSTQLAGEAPPLLCNVIFPSTLTGIDPNRDCDQMPKVLAERYNISPDEAAQLVNQAKQKKWD